MQRRMIAIVNGYPRAGKDKVVEMMSERLNHLGWYCSAKSSVEPVKENTRALGIPDDPKTPEKRALWAEIKSAYEKYDRFLTRKLMQEATETLVPGDLSIFFIHVREPEAIQFMWDILAPGIEFLTIFVDRPDAERVTSNSADMDVENYAYNVRIENAGTLQHLNDSCRNLADIIHKGNL